MSTMDGRAKAAALFSGILMISFFATQADSQTAVCIPGRSRCGSGPVQDAIPQWDLGKSRKHPVQNADLRETAQRVCRSFIKGSLKAPDATDFQAEDVDSVGWVSSSTCQAQECTKGRIYVFTRAYALNSYGARLLHRFSCEVDCDPGAFCAVRQGWEVD